MHNSDNKRLALNTVFLYFRMFITMAISIFTTRVILNSLGVNDYGVYNVVGGMVSLFAVLTTSLSASISRFITFELGRNNNDSLRKVFSTAVMVQIIMSGIIFFLGTTVGFWFLNTKMNIEDNRIIAANWVLFFTLLGLVINLISIPYNAEIIAHERMRVFAWIGIIEVVIKLIIAYSIFLFKEDKLVFYALLLFISSLIIRCIYGFYCKSHFEECNTKIKFEKNIFKQMWGFAGWTFIGTSSAALQNQGINILLNLFFGTIINASYAIGNQVNNAITSFASNFMIALNPQITKSYAKGDYGHLRKLIYKGSKLCFYLLWLIAIVVLLNTDYILKLWLKEVPEYSVVFVQLFLIFSLIEMLSNPMITAQAATGKVKLYQICVGGFRLLVLPIAYILLKLGFPPQYALVVVIISSFCMLIMRMLFLKKGIKLDMKKFLGMVIGRATLVVILSLILSFLAIYRLPVNFGFFVLKTLICFSITLFIMYSLGCSRMERQYINTSIGKLVNKFRLNA